VSVGGSFTRVDHLVIAVRDLDAAARGYATLLGLRPSWRGTHPALGTRNVLFGLANCYIELLSPAQAPPRHPVAAALGELLARKPEALFGIALGTETPEATADALRARGLAVAPATELEAVADTGAIRRVRTWAIAPEHTRGVPVFAITHERGELPRAEPAATPSTAVSAVDHVVLFSDDLDGGLRLWRDAFAIPERWRREIPERGTVNVGLRLGGVTIELVAPLGAAQGERGERLWGVAYRVADCDAAVARVRAAGIAVSDTRAGLAPATRVATVKWSDGVPTLLLQNDRH
jgi:catechol 2,3-dioxygenase-like lactoylglutathione lyase family enzyme